MWITQEFHILILASSSHLLWKYSCFEMICSFFTCLKDMILSFYLVEVMCLHINLFAFICLVDSHWNLSGKWGVSTFIEVFSPRPDCTFKEFMAWSLSGFPSGPLPVYISYSTKETVKTSNCRQFTQDSTVQLQLELLVQQPSWQLPLRFQLPNGVSC